ncbi:MAG: LytTR family DNA-binding domain-containing protein [Bacteroidota bacterium]
MANVLIIEDEQLAAEKLSMFIRQLRPEWHIRDTLTTVADSVNWLSQNRTDLIFMDINLADGLCFKIFEQTPVEAPIIFTTAYDQYAIKAFKQNSLDYLLKPITAEDLKAGIEKFEKYRQNEVKIEEKIKQLLTMYSPADEFRKRILITYGGKSKSILIENVAYIYAFEKGVYLTSFDGQTFLTDDSLDLLEQTLNPKTFYRLNRKYLISIKAIGEIHKYSTRRLKVDLQPMPKFEAIVPAEKITSFKEWLNK